MTQHSDNGYVKSEVEHGILTIEFFHPKANALPGSLLRELARHIRDARNRRAKVIVLKSAGERTFCAGASFDELLSIDNEEDGFRFFTGFAEVIDAMMKSDKLIIARVQGRSVGGGVGIVAAADYAIGCEKSEVKLSELGIGIGPFVIGPVLQRKIGISAFSQLTVDATRWYSARWAEAKGLLAEVHTTKEDMDDAVIRLSSALASYSTEAMGEMKRVFWEGCTGFDDLMKERARTSGRLVMGKPAREALRRFKNRE